ncbi:MAG: hypothetical protein AAGJ46_02075 [Planctomycetota bacterium]
MPFRPILLVAVVLSTLPADTAYGRRRQQQQGRPADAMEVWSCAFDDDNWDVNYDRWPDRWRRQSGPGYPHYVEIALDDDSAAKAGRALVVQLDGAQASISSPPILVMAKFSYCLDLRMKIEEAPNSEVYVKLDYLDAQGKVRQSTRSEPVPATGAYESVEIEPVRPRYNDITNATVRIETVKSGYGDLHGRISIGDVWLGRQPSLDVSANNPFHVYTDPTDVKITCSLSGIRERDPKIRFQLLDATSQELGVRGEETLDGKPIVTRKLLDEETRRASDIVDGVGNHAEGYEGSTEWTPHIERHGKYGFYQVRVEMLSSETGKFMDKREVTLAVIPPEIAKTRGEFGWTLPTADRPLQFDALEKILPLVGINWLKVPIWFSPEDPHRGEDLLQFTERLAANDIETIGILQHPETLDPDIELEEELLDSYSMANVMGEDSSRWVPLYDHIMTRLSLRIRWWQIGADHDTSFVGYEDLIGQIANIRRQLYRFGQDVDLAIGWRWDTELLPGRLSWEVHQLSSKPPQDADGLNERLGAIDAADRKLWVLIEPAVDETVHVTQGEQHTSRVREFVEQIVVAKRHGADAIFAPDPFSGKHGLMTPEGKPGELLLPWRTSAMLLSGAQFMGHLQLPGGSQNWLFRRADGQVVMVLWNTTPAEETLYLGDDIMAYDVWGKAVRPEKDGVRDRLRVGPMPLFVLGLNEAVARWRMSVQFAKDRIPSIFGQDHINVLRLVNGFPQGVGGQVRLFVPNRLSFGSDLPVRESEEWKISTPADDFSVGANKPLEFPLLIRLQDAAIGEQPIRIDFEVAGGSAEGGLKFSVWRTLHVGLGDVTIDAGAKLDEDGRLLVHQHMTNSSGLPMSFKCYLRAPGRRRKRAQVFELGPEPDVKTYTYSQGEELIGRELKLIAREIDGPRVLIQRFIATP